MYSCKDSAFSQHSVNMPSSLICQTPSGLVMNIAQLQLSAVIPRVCDAHCCLIIYVGKQGKDIGTYEQSSEIQFWQQLVTGTHKNKRCGLAMQTDASVSQLSWFICCMAFKHCLFCVFSVHLLCLFCFFYLLLVLLPYLLNFKHPLFFFFFFLGTWKYGDMHTG